MTGTAAPRETGSSARIPCPPGWTAVGGTAADGSGRREPVRVRRPGEGSRAVTGEDGVPRP